MESLGEVLIDKHHKIKTMNVAILTGNVGKNPDVEYLPGNVCKARFTLATSEYYKNAAGETQEKTTWHNLVAWRKTAELVEKYVQKGLKVSIIGRISNTSSEKDGVKKYFSSVVVKQIEFLSSAQPSNDIPDDSFDNPENY